MISIVSIVIFLYGVYKTLTGPISEERRVESRMIPYFMDDKRYEMVSGVRTLEWAIGNPPSYHHYDHIPMMNEVVVVDEEDVMSLDMK